MNYAQLRKFDVANGPGVRSVLFVSGCTHNCPGCFNGEYQNFSYGSPWTKETEDKFIEMTKDNNVHGISILGGEPLQQDGDMALLFKRLKEEVGKNIWVYSGYTFEYLLSLIKNGSASETIKALFEYVDVLVDGPFVESKKNIKLKFRGSSNQRILDVKKSLQEGVAIEWPIK